MSCGIDSERIRRFRRRKYNYSDFMPFVFTKRELSHCEKFLDPARALCASFCIKEGLFKALGKPYNFTDCEFFPNISVTGGRLCVSQRLLDKRGTMRPAAMLFDAAPGHITAIVYLMKQPSSTPIRGSR